MDKTGQAKTPKVAKSGRLFLWKNKEICDLEIWRLQLPFRSKVSWDMALAQSHLSFPACL